MSDEEFPKAIMIKKYFVLSLFWTFTVQKNNCLENDYSPTVNRKNEDMAGVEEIYYEPSDNLVVTDYMNLGQEYFLK